MSVNGIEITDVVVFPVKNRDENDNLLAFARIILNDQFMISGIRVRKGKNGPFISFPQNTCFPITAELRSYISDQVLMQYELNMSLFHPECVKETIKKALSKDFSDKLVE